ncbi:SipW-dependent-type signal peptide-containing protein [Candidatus Parcubacteria bacterium]|nr:SipW-dependent-type signal peptide-containing protein [Candidatus Parcubacteria bacterium]
MIIKKILISLLIIAGIASVATGITIAYFNDAETSTGNTFTAGSINIAVNGQDPWQGAGYFTISDMKPCDTHYKEFFIQNVGENEVDVWKRFIVTETRGGAHPEAELSEDPDDIINNIDSAIIYDLVIDQEIIIAEEDNVMITDINDYWIYLGTIQPGAEMEVIQSYHMQDGTTNWAQGDEMDFTIELYAQQTRNCPSAPETEHPAYGKPDGAYVEIGDPVSERGHLSRDADDWSYVGRLDKDGNGYLNQGVYGGYDGGDANFRGLMGPPTGCNSGGANTHATLVMSACDGEVTQLTLRHLDGSQDDSFDAYVKVGANWVLIGHYEEDGNPSETWITSIFDLPTAMTGKIEFKLDATDHNTIWCDQGWGQVMINWAQID